MYIRSISAIRARFLAYAQESGRAVLDGGKGNGEVLPARRFSEQLGQRGVVLGLLAERFDIGVHTGELQLFVLRFDELYELRVHQLIQQQHAAALGLIQVDIIALLFALGRVVQRPLLRAVQIFGDGGEAAVGILEEHHVLHAVVKLLVAHAAVLDIRPDVVPDALKARAVVVKERAELVRDFLTICAATLRTYASDCK